MDTKRGCLPTHTKREETPKFTCTLEQCFLYTRLESHQTSERPQYFYSEQMHNPWTPASSLATEPLWVAWEEGGEGKPSTAPRAFLKKTHASTSLHPSFHLWQEAARIPKHPCGWPCALPAPPGTSCMKSSQRCHAGFYAFWGPSILCPACPSCAKGVTDDSKRAPMKMTKVHRIFPLGPR